MHRQGAEHGLLIGGEGQMGARHRPQEAGARTARGSHGQADQCRHAELESGLGDHRAGLHLDLDHRLFIRNPGFELRQKLGERQRGRAISLAVGQVAIGAALEVEPRPVRPGRILGKLDAIGLLVEIELDRKTLIGAGEKPVCYIRHIRLCGRLVSILA